MAGIKKAGEEESLANWALRDVENINVPSIAWIRVDFARLAISKCEGIVSYFELFEMANRAKAT